MRTPTPWPLPQRPTTSGQLLAHGVSRRMLTTALERGDIVRLRRDVYVAADRVTTDPRQRHLLRAQAEQAANPALIAVGATAALALRLPFAEDQDALHGPPVLLAPKGSGSRASRTRTAEIRIGFVPEHQVEVVESLRVTTPARTAVDLARRQPLPKALVPLDAAARSICLATKSVPRRRDFANPRLHRMAQDVLLQAADEERMTPSLHNAIERADPRRETVIESLSAGHMTLAGLPQPIPQAEIRTVQGSLWPDFLWPEHRLIGEVDGAVKYQTPQAMMQEKRREQVLRDLGFDFVRWVGHEIWATPHVVMARITRALERNAR